MPGSHLRVSLPHLQVGRCGHTMAKSAYGDEAVLQPVVMLDWAARRVEPIAELTVFSAVL
ncbi:unnamed protein product, partial [Protopolystoma xenopodis]